MKKIMVVVVVLCLLSLSAFAQEKVVQLEKGADNLFAGEFRNATLQEFATAVNAQGGASVEIDPSLQAKTFILPYQFDKVDALGLIQAVTVFDNKLKYRKIKNENKYVLEPVGVNTSGEDITEDDLAEYYDTTVTNPEPQNTQRIVFQNGRVISGKLIPTSQRATGSKWTVIKNGIEYTKTVEEILPGKKIEFIDRELVVNMRGTGIKAKEWIAEIYPSYVIKEEISGTKFVLEIPENEDIKAMVKKFMDEYERSVLSAQPNGISPLTITPLEVWPNGVTTRQREDHYLPGVNSADTEKHRLRYSKGYISVLFKTALPYEELLFFANKYIVFLYDPLRGNEGRFSTLDVSYFADTLGITNKIKNDPRIEEGNTDRVGTTNYSPNDPEFNAIDNTTSQFHQWGLHIIRALNAWSSLHNLNSVTVAILDSGYYHTNPDPEDTMHPGPISTNEDLPQAMVNRQTTNIGDPENPSFTFDSRPNGISFTDPLSAQGAEPYPLDIAGHGSMVAGIVGAITNNSIGVAGLAPYDMITTPFVTTFNILPLKVAHTSTGNIGDMNASIERPSTLANAINYASGWRNKAGDTRGGYPLAEPLAKVINISLWTNEAQDVKDAIDKARVRGCLVVAAAGNNDIGSVDFPANYRPVLAVGATDENDHRVERTSHDVDLVDVAAPGNNVCTTGFDANYNAVYQGTPGWHGTSFAAPMVAGEAALIWAKNPNLTVEQVIESITTCVSTHFDSTLGMGSGIINVAWALNPNGDTNAPTVSNQTPEPNGSAPANSTITFDLNDDLSCVDISTINVYIGVYTAISNGVIQPGFSGTITPNGTGGYTVSITPAVTLTDSSILVNIHAEDNKGGQGHSLASQYTFTAHPSSPGGNNPDESVDVSRAAYPRTMGRMAARVGGVESKRTQPFCSAKR